MRWDAVLHPVGSLPAAAYWLRRAVVIGLPLLLLIVVVAVASSGGSGAKRAAAPLAAPTGSAASASAAAPTPSGAITAATASSSPVSSAASTANQGSCPDSSLAIAVKVRATSYPAGSPPQFVVTVTNTGTVACTRNVGVGGRVVTITSGSDRIWSSADCATPVPDLRPIAPGQVISLASAWDRRRSSPHCATGGTAGSLALPGSYLVTASLGTLGPSAGAAFSLS